MKLLETSESVQLTYASGAGVGNLIYIQAHLIMRVDTYVSGLANAKVTYWPGFGPARVILVQETRAAIATAATTLITITPTAAGTSAYSVGVNFIQDYQSVDQATPANGCTITVEVGDGEPKPVTVSETALAIQSLINAASPGGNLVTTDTAQLITGQKTFDVPILYSNAFAVTAAGTTQGTGTALTKEYNMVTTATQAQGVVLPADLRGISIKVFNRAGTNITLLVYPATGANFEGLAANLPVALPAGWSLEADNGNTGATQWRATFMKYSDPLHTGVTAFATGGQASAVELLGLVNTVTTVATAADSVKVMLLARYPNAAEVFISNTAANAANLFPATGEDIGAGVNTAVSIPGGSSLTLKKISETAWLILDSGGDVTLNTAQTITATKTFSAPQLFANGAVGAPSISFSASPTNGRYRVSATQTGEAIGGALVGGWDTNGAFTNAIAEQVAGAGVAVDAALLKDGSFITVPTPAAINVSATATAAQMLGGVITSTSAAAVALTTPTAASIYALIQGGGAVGKGFYLSIDNSVGANTVTLTLDASITAPVGAITGGNDLTVTTTHKVGLFWFYFVSATAAHVFRVA